MTEQYFFAFSEGSYSDYGMNGLYVCDHEVTRDEWYEHLAKYEKELAVQRLKANEPEDWSSEAWEKWHDSPERNAYFEWVNDNDPEKSFQELHGMVKIEYEEFWRDN